jgi:hypothetical protein
LPTAKSLAVPGMTGSRFPSFTLQSDHQEDAEDL